jgi:hypothetical protein
MSAVYVTVLALALALYLYTFVHDLLPMMREEHRARQQSRLEWDGYAPQWWMGWTYWIGAEHLFFRRKWNFEPVRDNCSCDDAGHFSGQPHRHMGFIDKESA